MSGTVVTVGDCYAVWRWQLVIRQRLMRSLMWSLTAREPQSYVCFTTTSAMRWVQWGCLQTVRGNCLDLKKLWKNCPVKQTSNLSKAHETRESL